MVKLIIFFLSFTVTSLSAQFWKEASSLPNPVEGRHHPVTFSIGEFGYVGLGSTPNRYSSEFYKYDPKTDSWDELNMFPGGGRGFAIGVAYEGKAYVGFGYDERGNFQSDLWEYDPEFDKWKKLKDCPGPARAHPALLALNGKVYMGLGSGNGMDLKDWWEYDIASNNWTQKPDIPGKARHHPFQFVIPPYLYAGMGHGGPVIYSDLYRFDPKTDTWTEMARVPREGRVAGTQFEYKGRGYVLSGQGEDHDYLDTGEFFEYDASLNAWKELPAHPGKGRWAPGSFVIGDKIYFTCGQDDIKYHNDVWVFDFTILTNTNKNDELKISNLTSDFITLKNSKLKISEISISDSYGNDINSQVQIENHSSDITINTNRLKSGIYFIQAKGYKGLKFVKI